MQRLEEQAVWFYSTDLTQINRDREVQIRPAAVLRGVKFRTAPSIYDLSRVIFYTAFRFYGIYFLSSTKSPIFDLFLPAMSGSRFLEVNHRIEEERRMKYRGTASIELTSLCFQDSNESNGNCTQRSADGLKRMFQEEHGCRQEGARHHAIAVISQRHLDAALEAAGLPAARLLVDSLPYPELELPPNVQLDCLQGRDRILAADNVFEGTNKRWVVDLFLDGTVSGLDNDMRLLTKDLPSRFESRAEDVPH